MIELKLKNYRRFVKGSNTEDEFHEISFQPGLTLITGPNGSGKTTLVEALGYSLYGSRHVQKRDITPDDAKDTEVILKLEIDNQPIKVRRWGNRAELWVNDALQVKGLPGSVSQVSQQLSALLGGLTPGQFKHTYFAQQGDTAGLVEAKPDDRQKTVAQILQLDILKKAVEIQEKRRDEAVHQVKTQGRNVSNDFQFGSEERKLLDDFAKPRTEASRLERIRLFQKRIDTVVSDRQNKANDEADILSKAEEVVGDLRAKCLTHRGVCDEAQAKVEEFEQLEREYNTVGQKITTLIALQERVQQEADKLIEQIKHAEECADAAYRYKLLLEQIEGCDRRLSKLPLVKELYKALTTAQDKKRDLDKKLGQLKNVDQELLMAKSKEIEAEERWSQLATDPTTAELQAWEVHKVILDNQEKEVRAALQALDGDSEKVTCPACNHPLSQHHRGERLRHLRTWLEQELPNQRLQLQEQKTTLDHQRETWQQNKGDAFEAWDKARRGVGDAQRRVDQRDGLLQQHNTVVEELEAAQKAWDQLEEVQPYDPTESGRVRGKQRELKEQASQIKDDSDLYDRLPDLRKTLQEKNEENDQCVQNIKEQRQRQSEVGYDSVAHRNAKVALSKTQGALSKLQADLQAAELNVERYRGVTEQAQQAAERAKRAQCQLEEDITQFQREDQLFTLLKNFHDHFFKANTEQVCQRASELILHAVEDGSILGIEFDERGQIYYLDASNHRRLVTDTRPSGGEKALIGLCLRIALAEQAQFITRTGKLRFLVLDEVLSSLDDERRDAVQQIFEDVQQRGVFEHIIMITHLDAVKQHWRAHGLKVQKVGTKASRVIPVDIQDISMNFEEEEK